MTRRERTFRGISLRLAVHYLENLGGHEREREGEGEGEDKNEDEDERRIVEGEDWRATLTSERVSVGPTLSLTAVTVVFEGDEDGLDALVEQFARKAMRAGG